MAPHGVEKNVKTTFLCFIAFEFFNHPGIHSFIPPDRKKIDILG
jgi:hypothetical protein